MLSTLPWFAFPARLGSIWLELYLMQWLWSTLMIHHLCPPWFSSTRTDKGGCVLFGMGSRSRRHYRFLAGGKEAWGAIQVCWRLVETYSGSCVKEKWRVIRPYIKDMAIKNLVSLMFISFLLTFFFWSKKRLVDLSHASPGQRTSIPYLALDWTKEDGNSAYW